MSHLGRWLSALVDGELNPAERDRVLNHLAGCRPCLREANEMRALKRRLTALGDSCDDGAIAGRLIELARFQRGAFGFPAGLDTRRSGERIRARVLGRRLIRLSLIRHGWTMAAGSAAAALAAIGFAAFLFGNAAGMAPVVPSVTPSVDSYVLQHAYDAGQARVRQGSGFSLLSPDRGTADHGAAGTAPPGAEPGSRRHGSSGTLANPAPVTSATALPTASGSAPAAPTGQSPGSTSARLRAP